MKYLLQYIIPLLVAVCPLSAAEKMQASSSSKIRGTGTAQDGALFGGVEKDAEYLAKTNAIIDAVNRAIEGQSDAVRKLFKDGWGKTTSADAKGMDRRGADDFISQQIVTESPGSGVVDFDKKTRTVTYVFVGTLDMRRLLDVLGGDQKSKLVPLVFYSMRETSEQQERVFGEATSEDVKRLKEVEGKLEAKDDSTLKTEAMQLKAKIIKTRENLSAANKYKFAISDIGPRQAFGGQVKATLQDLGFEEFVDGALNDLSKKFNEANASGEEVEPSLLRDMTRASIDEDADYVIIMKIDFEFPQTIGLTGRYECRATATGDVYKKPEAGSKRSARSVAALDPIVITGMGGSEQAVKKEAAILVAKDAAVDINAKLRSNKRL